MSMMTLTLKNVKILFVKGFEPINTLLNLEIINLFNVEMSSSTDYIIKQHTLFGI
jgi:hypothetical protein